MDVPEPHSPDVVTPVLSVENAHMAYGKHVVFDDFSLTVQPGSVTALVGENGCGKSTLLRGLSGFQPMQFSTFQLLGEEVTPSSRQHQQAVCSVLGQSIWMRGLTVWDHFRLFAPQSKCEHALDLFDIFDLADRVPATLSTGQLQRANLASTAVRPWDLLLLDEPEAGLDADHQGALADYLQDEVGSRAVIVATHAAHQLESVITEIIDL